MSRRTAALALTAVALTCAVVPAEAAKKKPKPKPIKGSYELTLLPDPTPNALESCGTLPTGTDERTVKLPAAGVLQVVLDSPDPAGVGALDWDLHLLDKDGEIAASTSGGGHEEVFVKFKKKTDVVIQVCNLNGLPQGSVNYTFTFA